MPTRWYRRLITTDLGLGVTSGTVWFLCVTGFSGGARVYYRVQPYDGKVALYITYLLNYLFTPWSRVLLEKLTGLHLVKKFPAFYGTRRFIIALTSARHLSLS